MTRTLTSDSAKLEPITTESIYLKLFSDDDCQMLKLKSNYSWSLFRIENFKSHNNKIKLIYTNETLTEEICTNRIVTFLNKKKTFGFSYDPQQFDLFEVKILTKNGYLNRTFCFIDENWCSIEINSNDFLIETIQSGFIRIIKRKKIEFKNKLC